MTTDMNKETTIKTWVMASILVLMQAYGCKVESRHQEPPCEEVVFELYDGSSTAMDRRALMDCDDAVLVKESVSKDAPQKGDCIPQCIPPSDLCLSDCDSPLTDSKTEDGQRYVQHQIVLTFPDDIDGITLSDSKGNSDNPSEDNPFTYLTFETEGGSKKMINIADILNQYFDKVNSNSNAQGRLERCLCDGNVFLYTNENLIFEEGGIQQTNKGSGGVTEEGGVFSLNYILEHWDSNAPTNQNSIRSGFKDKGQLGAKAGVMIAILDSGLDPRYVPANSLYYNTNQSAYICGLEDAAGWNFVDNNANVNDDRGHGTLVSLSYFYALSMMKPSMCIENQSLLTVKVLNQCGEGTTYSTVCGMKYAAMKGAKIINTSWGMYKNDQQLQRAVEALGDKGITLIASAGNQGHDLARQPHFPSGYASQFDYIINNGDTESRPGMNHVIEVGGLCSPITNNCIITQQNTPLSSTSNYRDILFVEASRGIEQLLPPKDRPSCEIVGTSYAAPQLAAGVVHQMVISKGAINNTLIKDAMWQQSKTINVGSDHRSYVSAQCN